MYFLIRCYCIYIRVSFTEYVIWKIHFAWSRYHNIRNKHDKCLNLWKLSVLRQNGRLNETDKTNDKSRLYFPSARSLMPERISLKVGDNLFPNQFQRQCNHIRSRVTQTRERFHPLNGVQRYPSSLYFETSSCWISENKVKPLVPLFFEKLPGTATI